MSAKKSPKPKARRPRGFIDRPGDVLRAERALIAAASQVYERSGFEPLETPAFEYADALGKFLPDADRPNEGVFALTDDDDQWMALRYDLTAPLARYAAEHYQDLAKPFRRYQAGEVWRNEKPGPGRYRQFVQCDADTVGAAGPAADAEMIALGAQVMAAAGLAPGEYVIRVSDRRLLEGLLEGLGAAAPARRLAVLRALDKLDRLGMEGVAALLGEGRLDESGDFTQGAGLEAAQTRQVLAFAETGGAQAEDDPAAILARLEPLVGATAAGREGLESLSQIFDLVGAFSAGTGWARLDTAIVRGLGYYTGPVFEAELLLETTYETGAPVRFGSVGGGGRYDDLIARFTGQKVPATGFSFGVSRFAAALAALGRLGGTAPGPLAIILNLEADLTAQYFALAEELRATGFRAEVFVGSGNMGKQLKYADRRGADYALIWGQSEEAAGEIAVKDLKLGARLAETIEDREAWRDQPQQFTLPRPGLAQALAARVDLRTSPDGSA